MYQFKDPQDTIVAIATPSGQGGIGIVRLSGPDAITIADQMFVAKSKRRAPDLKNFMVHYGWAVDPASNRESPDIIDEVLMTIMRSPQSYTCEDVVEFNCHGGMVVLKTLVATAIHHGARLAEPGEFTKRAFLNGRIDLTQAEAVLDIIQSKTESFLRVSTHQLKGELSTELEKIREELLLAYTEIEAIVNFPEDDIDAQGKQKLQHEITSAKHQVDRLLASSTQGRILREGIRIVICGKPNVGKSSLLNVLLKTPRAIVSQIAGTTRDTIEETAQIRGIPIQLIDTAGILEPRDLIEEEAIKRSHQSIQGADLVLLVLDGHEHASAEDEQLMTNLKGRPVIVLLNKCDLPPRLDVKVIRRHFPKANICTISALHQTGLDQLESAIVEEVTHGQIIEPQGVLVNNLRHIEALQRCREHLAKAMQLLNEGTSLEFISEEIKGGINELDSITGRNIDQDLLDTIFAQFCIGK